MDIDFNSLPEVKEAVEREEFVRNSAFLGLSETVAGFELKPFTFRRWLTLRVAKSPLVIGGIPTAAHIAGLLWLCSVDNSDSWLARHLFYRRCRRLSNPLQLREAVLAIRLYISEAMMDSPASGNGSSAPTYYSDAAWVCARMAREYGYGVDTVLDMPLKILWQFMNEIKEEAARKSGKVPVLFNPISDPVRRIAVKKLSQR